MNVLRVEGHQHIDMPSMTVRLWFTMVETKRLATNTVTPEDISRWIDALKSGAQAVRSGEL